VVYSFGTGREDMTQNVKDIGKLLACVVVYAFLFFVVGLSESRSFWCAVLLAVLLFWRALKRPHFEPYWVWIKPNWYPLLLDYGLIKNLEEWQQIVAKLGHIPASDYNVLRDGIRFTVLNPDLIYRNDYREFASDVRFTESLQEVSLYHPSGWFYHPKVYIGFALKSPPEGAYEIRITATDSVEHKDCNEKGATVAVLPWVEFSFYREDPGEFRHWDKLRAKRDKQMQEHGWMRDETDVYYGGPSSIEHKYFTVQHKRI
jgi:hypothetical protein